MIDLGTTNKYAATNGKDQYGEPIDLTGKTVEWSCQGGTLAYDETKPLQVAVTWDVEGPGLLVATIDGISREYHVEIVKPAPVLSDFEIVEVAEST